MSRRRRATLRRRIAMKPSFPGGSSSPPKWKKYENVIAAIERSLNAIPGANVVRNTKVPERIAGRQRQVDVFVEIPTGPRTFRVGVEVRDRSSPLDIEDVEQSITKLKKLDIDCGVIVSRSGFTSEATAEGARSGIEMRTVESIELPEWWLASSMMVDLRQVELVKWKINFRADELPEVRELLACTSDVEIDVHQEGRPTRTLHNLVTQAGIDAMDCPDRMSLPDQGTFAVRISFESNLRLTCVRGPLPRPQEVLALYRVHHRTERVELGAFAAGPGVSVMSGVSATMRKQLTVVAKLQADGSRKLDVSLVDPMPSNTIVDRREATRHA